MNAKPLKERLFDTLAQAQERERVLIEHCDDSAASSPAWTAKDHLVHLAHWRRHAGELLDQVRSGAAPPAEENMDEINEVNAGVHAANRSRPAHEVKHEARDSYAALHAAVEACTEEQLAGTRPGGAGAIWELVPGNGHTHVGQHLTYWHQSLGDEHAAEQIQLWVRDLHVAAFPDPAHRASAEYNLGCYYATVGRSADAIPLISEGILLNPSLKEWARTDHDLDSIREHSALPQLLT